MKTLSEMQEEVGKVNRKLGWWDSDHPVTLKTAMALLHSEVSEALDAWRQWGMEDKTPPWVPPRTVAEAADKIMHPPKPEGAPSELADVMIRFLDDLERFDVTVREECWTGWPWYVVASGSFPDDMDDLHNQISRISMTHDSEWPREDVAPEFERLLVALRCVARYYGVDLMAEYERKLAYNRTRPYRHGNRRV
jgi:NTP pyrophosphatase (non-canonical NTP hydrolase)